MGKPELPRGYLGPQPKFAEYGLQTNSHSNPEIDLDGNMVEIKFKMTKEDVKVTGNLIQVSTGKEFSDLIFTQCKDKTVSFLVQFPECGYYKLQIYALPVTDESKTLPGVFNFLINCNNIENKTRPYPKQYAQWKEGCYLFEPFLLSKEHFLKSEAAGVAFRVVVPNAKAVAVVCNDDWTQLVNTGKDVKTDKDVWQGHVKTKGADKVTLNANFGGEELKYSTLLEYTL